MVDQRIAVVIESFFNQKGFSQSLSTLKAFENHIQSTNKAMAELSRYNVVLDKFGNFRDAKSNGLMGPTFEKQIVNTNKRMNKFNSNWDATYNSIMKSGNMLSKPQNNMFSSIDSFSKKALKNLKAARANFSMEFLGVMFFGMMLQKFFTSLAKSTVSSFMKITEGMTSSGQAVSALMVSWELLKFSIGSAIASVLEGLMPVIMPIISGIIDWVQQNEKLTGSWILIGAAIGGALFLFGQMWLGVEALNNVFSRLFGASFLGSVDKANTKLSVTEKIINGIGKVVGIYFLIEGISGLLSDTENFLGDIGTVFEGIGFIWGGKKGGMVALGGIALRLLDEGLNQDAITWTSMFRTALESAFAGYLVGGVHGAFIAVGAAIVFRLLAPGVQWTQDLIADTKELKSIYQDDSWISLFWDRMTKGKDATLEGDTNSMFDDMGFKSMTPKNETIDWFGSAKVEIKSMKEEFDTIPPVLNETIIKSEALNKSVANFKPPSADELKGTIFDPEATKKSSVAVDSYTTAVSGLDTALGGASDNNGKKTGGLNSAFSTLTTDFNDFSLFLENTYLPLMDDLQDSLWANARAASAAAAAHERYNRALEGSTGGASD